MVSKQQNQLHNLKKKKNLSYHTFCLHTLLIVVLKYSMLSCRVSITIQLAQFGLGCIHCVFAGVVNRAMLLLD